MFTALNHVSSTPPVIAGKTVSKMQALQSVTGELTVDYDGTISYMGIGVDIGVDADLEVQILTGEHMRSHETGTVTIEALGFSYPVALENYALQEEDGFTSYINLQKGKWLRHHGTGTESEKTESFDSTKFVFGMIQKIMQGEIKAEASKETEMLGDQEVRRMDIAISGPALQELVKSVAESGKFDLPADLDLSESSCRYHRLCRQKDRRSRRVPVRLHGAWKCNDEAHDRKPGLGRRSKVFHTDLPL